VPVESDRPIQKDHEENDGMGTFRTAAYIAAFTGAERVPGLFNQEARRTAELADQTVNDIVTAFRRQWDQALKGKVDFDIKAVTRLAKAGNADLEGMRFMKLGQVTDEYQILHANISRLRRLSKAASLKKLKSSKTSPSNFLILDNADQVIAAENIRYVSQFKGVDISGSMDWTDVKNLKTKCLTVLFNSIGGRSQISGHTEQPSCMGCNPISLQRLI
jgi:hypothetical protein